MFQKSSKIKTTYLKEFFDLRKRGVVYWPLGVIEWHGGHLPLETDFMVAAKIAELVSKKIPGYILPPFYLGTDKKVKKRGVEFRGMDRHLGKILPGSIYYLEPKVFIKLVDSVVKNLITQGFKKIILIAGHAGSAQIEALKKVEKSNKKNIIFINPFKGLDICVGHADEYELSLLWACYPEEKNKSLKERINTNDDFLKHKGYDPRPKASLEIGRKLLKKILLNAEKEIGGRL